MSALSTRVNILDVWLVIYIRLPCSLQDFVQESRQARQDSQVSQSVIIISAAYIIALSPRAQGGSSNKASQVVLGTENITDFVWDTTICCQAVLSQVLDGQLDRDRYYISKEQYNLCNCYIRTPIDNNNPPLYSSREQLEEVIRAGVNTPYPAVKATPCQDRFRDQAYTKEVTAQAASKA